MRFKNFLILIVLVFALTGCKPKEEPIISFEKDEFEIYVNEEFTINPDVQNLQDLDLVEHLIIDPNVVKFENGKFIGLKAGNTNIEFTIKGYDSIKETIKVTVLAEHQITYELNGGVLLNPRKSFKKGDLPLTLQRPTRDGYVFKGWYYNEDYSGVEVKALSIEDTKDLKLYAKWEEYVPTYTILYLLGGGRIENPINSFTANDLPLTLPIPTRNGYKFLGWYSNSEFDGVSIKEIKLGTETNQKFYARWEKEAPIDYSDILVDLTIANKEDGDLVSYNNVIYIVGQTAFASIQDAIAKTTKVITLAPGIYSESFNILKSNVMILGPNNRLLPWDKNRSDEAVLTGQISLGNVDDVTISGITFKGESQIKSEAQITNFEFSFNIVEETANATSTWTATQANVNSIISLYNTNTDLAKISKTILINNNFFDGVSEYIISLARVSDVNIQNNVFNNFSRDAIRLDGGFNGGKFVVQFNEFTNDVQGAHNAIYLRIYGSDETSPVGLHEIEIHHNSFKNIGKDVEYSGAITARNYQEFGARISIMYNTFEACFNYIFIRNNATVENHSKYNWIANINHNSFFKIPNNYYFKNWIADDDSSTTPHLANFDNNYFEDDEENPITDLSTYNDKILGAASSINHYISKESYENYVNLIRNEKPISLYIKNPVYKMSQYDEYQLVIEFLPEGVSVSDIVYISDNNDIATVSSSGKITALKEGVVVITIKSLADASLKETIEITISKSPYIEPIYMGNSALKVGEKKNVDYTFHNLPGSDTILWSSSDETIAKVDQNGQITAVGIGNVIITLTGVNSKVETNVGFTVYGSEVTDELLLYLIELNRGNLFTKNVTYIGFQGNHVNRIYNTVNTYLAAPKDEIILNMLSSSAPNYDKRTMTIEYITVHDTGSAAASSTARANSNWNNNPTNTGSSWHYTVGNDGVFKQLDDNRVGWHAGDGTSVPFVRVDTGVKATNLKPEITITADGYYAFNGTKSLIKAPMVNGRLPRTTDIAPMGILSIIGENGNYWMGPTYYNTSYNKISNRGGNLASIGIETAVNDGSDVFWTWQKTAKLIAGLLTTHNLTPERVAYHNNFSGKLCPQTMMTAGLVGEFEAMVEAEYNIYKKYSDYTITFESHSPDIIDNSGRVVNPPIVTTNVSYTITVKKGDFIQAITLNALVPGQWDWR